VFHKIGEFIH